MESRQAMPPRTPVELRPSPYNNRYSYEEARQEARDGIGGLFHALRRMLPAGEKRRRAE